MSKVHYLNSHLEKFRKEPEIKIDLEDVEALAYYDVLVDEDKKTTKLFVRCFKNKETYKELFDWFRIDQAEFDKKYEPKIKVNEIYAKK